MYPHTKVIYVKVKPEPKFQKSNLPDRIFLGTLTILGGFAFGFILQSIAKLISAINGTTF